MFTCCICHFRVPLDDTIAVTPKGGCVCLRCYLTEVEDFRALPKDLRRQLTVVVATA